MKTRITSFLEKAGLTILSCLTLISSVWSQPQCMTDGFSTAAPWTSVGPAPVVGGGVLDFGPSGNSKCAYVYRSLTDDRTHDNFSLSASQSWTVEFAFSPTHPTPTMVPGHHLMSLTSTSDDAYNSCASGTAYGISILDAVDIFYACPSSSGGIATWGLTGCGKKAGVLGTASTPIYFNAINQIGMTFYIRLQCLTSGVCQLSVFTDPAFTTLFAPAQCFNVDPTISNLQYAQAGVIPQGGFYRGLNGTLRNLKVCNNRADMDMDPGVWTQTGTTVAINGTSGCVFNNSVDGADSRVDRSLEALVINSQSWNAQATFKLSSTSYTGPGHDILALSNGAGNNIFPMIVPTQDVIVAALVGTGSSMQMVGRAKQGNVWLNSSVGIPIPTAGTYYILLQRICATQGTIRLVRSNGEARQEKYQARFKM
jgi:hypothetical protein